MSDVGRTTERRSRRALLLLCFLVACHDSPSPDSDPDALPSTPANRQLDLGGRIFKGLEKLPPHDSATDGDAARAVAEIAVSGYAPRLRIIVAGDDVELAKGAATALVHIRVADRGADRAAVLGECAKTETNAFVRDECSDQSKRTAEPVRLAPVSGAMLAALESGDAEKRRVALRGWLDARPAVRKIDPDVLATVAERLKDDDLRARLLAEAVLLRDSLAAEP
jgi:hypothetical protein